MNSIWYLSPMNSIWYLSDSVYIDCMQTGQHRKGWIDEIMRAPTSPDGFAYRVKFDDGTTSIHGSNCLTRVHDE